MTALHVRSSGLPRLLGRRALALIAVSLVATGLAAVLRAVNADAVPTFVAATISLASLAALVGEGTEQLGGRLGPGATGVLQSALGNLPELLISIFALRAGLVLVVQTALVGSILANSLLVLGLAFIAGGARHGTQRFGSDQTRMMSMLIVLATAALTIPELATIAGAPDAGHARGLSIIVSVVLLVVFVASIPFSVGGGPGATAIGSSVERHAWPVGLAALVLVVAGLLSALASEWFVDSLQPAMATLRLSEAFVGLVIVAIAGNAVENVAGVQAALRNEADLAVSLILNSALQVALALTPALVLISVVMGGAALTLVLPPLLIAALGLSAVLGALIVVDGESTWLEGIALVGLYVIIAASVWWGAPLQP